MGIVQTHVFSSSCWRTRFGLLPDAARRGSRTMRTPR